MHPRPSLSLPSPRLLTTQTCSHRRSVRSGGRVRADHALELAYQPGASSSLPQLSVSSLLIPLELFYLLILHFIFLTSLGAVLSTKIVMLPHFAPFRPAVSSLPSSRSGQVSLKVLPALAAGCTLVLKPSELAPLSAMLFVQMLHDAGAPPGVVNLVNGQGDTAGEALCAHPQVDMVSFTGSKRAGVRVSKVAADSVKKVTLEVRRVDQKFHEEMCHASLNTVQCIHANRWSGMRP